jgi:hypothetical protein
MLGMIRTINFDTEVHAIRFNRKMNFSYSVGVELFEFFSLRYERQYVIHAFLKSLTGVRHNGGIVNCLRSFFTVHLSLPATLSFVVLSFVGSAMAWLQILFPAARSRARLAQDEKDRRASGEAGGRRGAAVKRRLGLLLARWLQTEQPETRFCSIVQS